MQGYGFIEKLRGLFIGFPNAITSDPIGQYSTLPFDHYGSEN